jgi:hypothetical protein
MFGVRAEAKSPGLFQMLFFSRLMGKLNLNIQSIFSKRLWESPAEITEKLY